jgi:hypothetical protein
VFAQQQEVLDVVTADISLAFKFLTTSMKHFFISSREVFRFDKIASADDDRGRNVRSRINYVTTEQTDSIKSERNVPGTWKSCSASKT